MNSFIYTVSFWGGFSVRGTPPIYPPLFTPPKGLRRSVAQQTFPTLREGFNRGAPPPLQPPPRGRTGHTAAAPPDTAAAPAATVTGSPSRASA